MYYRVVGLSDGEAGLITRIVVAADAQRNTVTILYLIGLGQHTTYFTNSVFYRHLT